MIACRGKELIVQDFTKFGRSGLWTGEKTGLAPEEVSEEARPDNNGPAAANGEQMRSVDGQGQSLSSVKEEIEKKAIIHALQVCGGNKTKTAEKLEISRTLLYRKLKKYGISG